MYRSPLWAALLCRLLSESKDKCGQTVCARDLVFKEFWYLSDNDRFGWHNLSLWPRCPIHISSAGYTAHPPTHRLGKLPFKMGCSAQPAPRPPESHAFSFSRASRSHYCVCVSHQLLLMLISGNNLTCLRPVFTTKKKIKCRVFCFRFCFFLEELLGSDEFWI